MAIKEAPAETEEIDSSVPISKDTPDNQYSRLKAWYIEDYKANSLWYSEAREDFAFESGDQWSEEDKEKDRLSVVFNRIKPTVDVICGMEVTNRQEVQFIPRTTSPAFPMLDPKTQQPIPPPEGADDAEVTEGYTEVTRWSRDNCDAEDEESDSFRDDVICGMGWCLSDDAMVRTPDTHFITTRMYSGVVIEIELESGQKLTGTPNHPVLTNTGWKKLCALDETDNLICGAFLERIARLPVEQFDKVETRLKDKVDTFRAGRKALRVATAANDFYADGAGSKVHVVYADGPLLDKLAQAARFKQTHQLDLIRRNALSVCGIALLSNGLSNDARLAPIGQFPLNVTHAPHSHVSSGNHLAQGISCPAQPLANSFRMHFKTFTDFISRKQVVKVHAAKLFNVIFGSRAAATTPKLVSTARKPLTNGGNRYSNFIRDFRDWKPDLEIQARNLSSADLAFPGLVTRIKGRIVRYVENFPVHDVGTSLGFFIAGGIITSNTETSMDYETEPEGRIVIDRRDPMQMGWDCAATKRNLDDAKRFHRTMSDISKQDAKAAFPKFDEGDLHAGFALESQFSEGGIAHDREKARNYENRNITEQRTKVTQVVIEWCEVESQNQVYNPADGTTFIATDEELKKLQERVKQLQGERDTQVKAMGAPPMGDTGQSMGATPDGMPAPEMPPEIPDVISAPVKKRCWYRATLGAKVLELKKAPCDFSSAFKCMTGYRDRNKKQWYGIVRPMRDPQRWANKFFSVALEQIAKSGKGIIAEEGTFTDSIDKVEKKWSRNNVILTKTGKSGTVIPKPQPPMLTGLSELMQLSLQAIRDVTGVNQETIGMADRDQAASLEYQRRQAGVTILAALFDNLRRYRKEQGRVHLYFIQNYISDGRLIRILGENGTPKLIQLMRQPDTIQYDVIVDQAPSSPNQKEAAWMVTKDIIPIMLQNGAGPSVMAELFKMSPMPESNVQRLRRANERDEQQRAQQGPSIEQQKLQADIQKAHADAQKSQADTAMKQQEMGLRKHEVDMTTALGLQQLKRAGEQQQADLAKSQLDIQAKAMELDKQREANALAREQMMLDHAKFMAEQETKQEEARAKAGERLLKDISQVIQIAEVKIDSVAGKMQTAQSKQDGDKASAGAAESKAELESLRSDMQTQIKALVEQLAKPKTAKFSADGMSATIQ